MRLDNWISIMESESSYITKSQQLSLSGLIESNLDNWDWVSLYKLISRIEPECH